MTEGALVFALVCLVVLLALVMFVGSIVLARYLIAYGRYQLDAGNQALKFQSIIDSRVAARTQRVVVDSKTGKVIAVSREDGVIGEQPPDPNVRTTSYIDEVHEAEREAQRLRNDDIPWDNRDSTTIEP